MSSPRQVPLSRTLRRALAVAALSVSGALAPGAVARAVPPTAADFQIRYYTTNADGSRARVMTLQDLQQFHNRARCECGQVIEAQITLVSASGMAFDLNQIRAFAGSNCGSGQIGNTTQNRPCVLLDAQLPNHWTKGPSYKFPPIWLSSGVSGGVQALDSAVPDRSCDAGQGEGGIWICVENGMQTDCQTDEFIVTGTQTINLPTMLPMGTTASGALVFDYDPPFSLPTGLEVSEGDGAVVLSWNQPTQDPNFRVLCADANDNPLPSKGVDAPSVTAENQGQLYYTEGNLCPEGPFDDTPEGNNTTPSEPIDPSGTGDGGRDTDSGSGDGGTVGASPGETAYEFWYGDPQAGGSVTGNDGGTTDGSTTGGSTTGGDSTDGTSTAGSGSSGSGGSGGSTTGGELPASGIESLDWAYVCTGHLAANAQSARVEGLDNGVEYRFLLVAYDDAGNPVPASEVLSATPRETTDLWEQCEQQGDICGDGGFCSCTTGDDDRQAPAAIALSLLALGLRRRRRS